MLNLLDIQQTVQLPHKKRAPDRDHEDQTEEANQEAHPAHCSPVYKILSHPKPDRSLHKPDEYHSEAAVIQSVECLTMVAEDTTRCFEEDEGEHSRGLEDAARDKRPEKLVVVEAGVSDRLQDLGEELRQIHVFMYLQSCECIERFADSDKCFFFLFSFLFFFFAGKCSIV